MARDATWQRLAEANARNAARREVGPPRPRTPEEAQFWHSHRDGVAHGHRHAGYHTHAGSGERSDQPLTPEEGRHWHSHTGASGEQYAHGHAHSGYHTHAGIDAPASQPAPGAPPTPAPSGGAWDNREWTWNPAANGDPNANLMVLADGTVINVNDPVQRAAYAQRNRQAIESVNAEMDVFAPGTPGAPAAAELDADRKRARDTLLALLGDYGLEALADLVNRMIIEGATEFEIMQAIRESSVYMDRFPGLIERRRQGLSPISEAEYVAYEREAIGLLRRAGMPQSFYDDRMDIGRFIAGDVSLSELSERITKGYNAWLTADPSSRAELQRMYGVSDGEGAAFFIDPDKAMPLILKRWEAAKIGAQSLITGYGQLTTGEAERLAALGVSEEGAREGFGMLGANRELFQPLPGEAWSSDAFIDRDEQLAAVFENGIDQRQAIERNRERRRAQFKGGGGAAAGAGGIIGAGSSTSND